MPWLTDSFKRSYLASLNDYKSFYDDLHEYGSARNPDIVIYFVPGFNGTAGQVRFAFPSVSNYHGPNVYVRSFYLKEFSAKTPVWEKYTAKNLEKHHQQIVDDIAELCASFREVNVIVSSSGFYDFLAAYRRIPADYRRRLKLAWIACAPDWSETSVWEAYFYRLNGFEHAGHRWFSYPNHNALRFINPECTSSRKWRYGRQQKEFFKTDLESRFWLGGVLWDYLSFDCYNWLNRTNIGLSEFPIDLPAVVLVATQDGYWLGKSRADIDRVIHKYLEKPVILYRKTTHLWVTVPENITAVVQAMDQLSPKPRRRTPPEPETAETSNPALNEV